MLTGAPSTGALPPWPAATPMPWRREVIAEVFAQEPGSELLAANRDYYARHIDDGTHEAFVAVADGEEAGCGGLCLYQELPSPDNPTGRCAYLMNIYVRKPYRRRGLGAAITRYLVEQARWHRCGKIYLESSDMASALYGSLGFRPMAHMMQAR